MCIDEESLNVFKVAGGSGWVMSRASPEMKGEHLVIVMASFVLSPSFKEDFRKFAAGSLVALISFDVWCSHWLAF